MYFTRQSLILPGVQALGPGMGGAGFWNTLYIFYKKLEMFISDEITVNGLLMNLMTLCVKEQCCEYWNYISTNLFVTHCSREMVCTLKVYFIVNLKCCFSFDFKWFIICICPLGPGLGRNKLMLCSRLCLASHGENVNAGCGKIIYYLFLDEINRKCASLRWIY